MWCTKLQMQLHLSYQWPPSPSSLCILNLPPPRSTSAHECDTLVFAVCLSPPLISSSFLTPSIPLLHQTLHATARTSHTLAATGTLTAGRKCSISQSGHPLAGSVRVRERRSALLTEEGGGETDHFISHSHPWRRSNIHQRSFDQMLVTDYWLFLPETETRQEVCTISPCSRSQQKYHLYSIHPPIHSSIHSSIRLPIHLFIQFPIHDKPTLPKPITKPASEQKHVTLVS